MGDRAIVIFHDESEVSPSVYLHWSGIRVPALIDLLKERMKGRYGDVDYAAARFIGICHEQIEGNLSLGVLNNDLTVTDLVNADRMKAVSHGGAGAVVVNTENFTWIAYAGYLADASLAAKEDEA